MKKRVAALLMALVMLVGLLPSAVWAEVAVTPVSTAAELAALGGQQITGSYKLTARHRHDRADHAAHQEIQQRHLRRAGTHDLRPDDRGLERQHGSVRRDGKRAP